MGSFVPAVEARDRPRRPHLHARRRERQPRRRRVDVHGRDARDRAHPRQPDAAQPGVLDEIGRGTSTFDGISIAWAVAEHLHDAPRAAADALRDPLPRADGAGRGAAARAQPLGRGRGVEGRRSCSCAGSSPGPAPRSYGVEVARLAGVPPSVVERARALLGFLEGGNALGPGRGPAPDLAPVGGDGAGTRSGRRAALALRASRSAAVSRARGPGSGTAHADGCARDPRAPGRDGASRGLNAGRPSLKLGAPMILATPPTVRAAALRQHLAGRAPERGPCRVDGARVRAGGARGAATTARWRGRGPRGGGGVHRRHRPPGASGSSTTRRRTTSRRIRA